MLGVKFILCFNDRHFLEVDAFDFFRILRDQYKFIQYDDDIEFNLEDNSIEFHYWKEHDRGSARSLFGKIIFC